MKNALRPELSRKLVRHVADIFPNSTLVRDVGLKAPVDLLVRDFAKEHGFVIMSKVSDLISTACVWISSKGDMDSTR